MQVPSTQEGLNGQFLLLSNLDFIPRSVSNLKKFIFQQQRTFYSNENFPRTPSYKKQREVRLSGGGRVGLGLADPTPHNQRGLLGPL